MRALAAIEPVSHLLGEDRPPAQQPVDHIADAVVREPVWAEHKEGVARVWPASACGPNGWWAEAGRSVGPSETSTHSRGR